jgi:hypothetical protein
MTSIKKGFVYSRTDDTAFIKIKNLNTSWYYNWNYAKTDYLTNIPFTPMVWGDKTANNQVIMDLLQVFDNSLCLLGFNEPDRPDQSNLTVDQAIALWPKLVATGRRLGSPATASNATKDGSWFDLFMKQNPKVDFICIHWYAAPNPSSLLNIIDTLYAKYNLPIWITEFAVADWKTPNKYTKDQVLDFMIKIIPELEKRDYVEKYSWKTRNLADPNMGSSSIFNDDGSLTDLGQKYKLF